MYQQFKLGKYAVQLLNVKLIMQWKQITLGASKLKLFSDFTN